MWKAPVVNRTQGDVSYANASRGSPTPNRGARNYTDLNRITGNIRVVRDLLLRMSVDVPELVSKEDWTVDYIPRYSDIARIKQDLESIRSSGFISPNTPEVPGLPYLYFEVLNDVEKIILDIYENIGKTVSSFAESGTFDSILTGGELT